MYFYYKIKDNKFNGFDVTEKKKNLLENGEFELTEEKYLKLQGGLVVYYEGTLKKITVPINPEIVKPIFDFETLKNKETATLEEQREYWLNKALETSKKIEEYKTIGLAGGQEYLSLEKELETYKKNYINACQSEAIAIDKHMSSTKPVK